MLCLTMTKQRIQATSGAFTNHEILVSYSKLQCKISDESLTDTNRRLHLKQSFADLPFVKLPGPFPAFFDTFSVIMVFNSHYMTGPPTQGILNNNLQVK